jgi:cytochrome b involved in lipid metabolism
MKLHVASAIAMIVLSALGFYFMADYIKIVIDAEHKKIVDFAAPIHVVLGFSTMLSLLINTGLGIKAYFHRINPESNWNTTAVIR